VGQAPPDKAGTASGIYKMASSLGSSFGLAISGAVGATVLTEGGSPDTAAAMSIFTSVGAALVAMVVVLMLVADRATEGPRPGQEHHHVGHGHARPGAIG
jgi:DHA2 family multidrug resistance protein-like MFS transporter